VLLVSCVAQRAEGVPVRVDPRLDTAVGRRLLVEFRIELVLRWVQAPSAPQADVVLSVWRACEEVLDEIGHGVQYAPGLDWDRDFANQLSGPRGLELVVEVAHDLRSPLTSILFLAETLQRGQSGPVNDIQKRQLGLVYSAALGLSTLASNVMELARGGSRLADDQPAPFSVADVMESVADIVRPMAEEKGLTVRLLPPHNDYRLGPAQALSRVLLNLTTNAIKFTEEGFVELVAKALDGERVEFSLRDSGHGINPATVETLFLPFRQGPQDDRVTFSGTGLGLALCRKLVEAMGSELRYETSADWGTRFYFELDLPTPPSA
jgi:signal transduction histidine kinase